MGGMLAIRILLIFWTTKDKAVVLILIYNKEVDRLKREHERFADLYAAGMNATRAYMECYPNASEKSAGELGSRLIRREDVHQRIIEKQKELYEAMAITPEKIAMKLAEMAFADKEDEVYTPQVAQKALDMLQKQLGLQKQQIKAEVDQETTIKVKINNKQE